MADAWLIKPYSWLFVQVDVKKATPNAAQGGGGRGGRGGRGWGGAPGFGRGGRGRGEWLHLARRVPNRYSVNIMWCNLRNWAPAVDQKNIFRILQVCVCARVSLFASAYMLTLRNVASVVGYITYLVFVVVCVCVCFLRPLQWCRIHDLDSRSHPSVSLSFVILVGLFCSIA